MAQASMLSALSYDATIPQQYFNLPSPWPTYIQPTHGLAALKAQALNSLELPGIFGQGGMTRQYTKKHFNTGFEATNTTVTSTIGVSVKNMANWDLHQDALVFGADSTSTVLRHRSVANVICLSKANAYLASEAGRRKYGGEWSYRKVKRDFTFLGQARTGFENWQQEYAKNKNISLEITLNVGGRVRIPDLSFAQASSNTNFKGKPLSKVAHETDYVYLLYVRCKVKDTLYDILERAKAAESRYSGRHASAASTAPSVVPKPLDAYVERKSYADMEIEAKKISELSDAAEEKKESEAEDEEKTPDYYWQILFVTMSARCKPPNHWYCNLDRTSSDFYVGDCQRLGRIVVTRGNRQLDPGKTVIARNIIAGGENWQWDLDRLPFLDIHLGVS